MRKLKIAAASLVIVLLSNLSACGTILYPERQGQTGGRIDPAIAILDGIGLLFFIIPGAIAFAVDFMNGTIYLPKTQASSGHNGVDDIDVIKATQPIDQQYLENLLARQAGIAADFNDPGAMAQQVSSVQAVADQIRYLQ
jgi:hypothetical protein